MSKVYEVVLWTLSVRRLAYAVADAIDHHKPRFHHVLNRLDTTLVYAVKKSGEFEDVGVNHCGGSKSLERLNRDMKDIVFVQDGFGYHPNLITAPEQCRSPNQTDNWLQEILPTILTMAGGEVKDVREYVMKHGLNQHFDPKCHLEPEYSSSWCSSRPLTQEEMDAYITANPKKWNSMASCQYDKVEEWGKNRSTACSCSTFHSH